jgi:hypothetical protein
MKDEGGEGIRWERNGGGGMENEERKERRE